MSTCVEQLPIELWLSIFSYLEAHDLFHAFNNLNTYFNQILASSYLSFYLNLKKTDNNHLKRPTNPYWSDLVLNRVIYLQSTNDIQPGYFIEFLRWNYKKLLQLQFLIFQMDLVQHAPIVCQILPKIYLLEYLSIICVMTPTLFQCIIALPTLRSCRLKITSTTYNSDFYSEKKSNLEILHVTLLPEVNYTCINLLLSYMPKLKRLQISATDIQSGYFIEFLRWNYKKLLQLQFLIFQMDLVQHAPIVCQILPKIYLLEYLSIICVMTPTLFQCILALPTLRSCRLKITSTTYNSDFYSEKKSNLKILHVAVLREVSYTCINLLLSYMPKLKRLEISATAFSIEKSINSRPRVKPFFTLPDLRILKYKFDYCCLSSPVIYHLYNEVCDIRCLDVIMPNLQYFDLNVWNINMTRDLSYTIADQWWMYLKKLEQVNIIIYGSYGNSCRVKKILDDHQKTFLSKNDELNNCFKFQWLRTNSRKSCPMEFTIKITKLNQ